MKYLQLFEVYISEKQSDSTMKYFLLENINNPTTNTDVWYHGSNTIIKSKEDIIINDESDKMFYGNAFYVASDIELARSYGKYLYEVKFDGDFYKVVSREMIGTYGTFNSYLDSISDSYRENILGYIEDNPAYWAKKLKISKKLLHELYKDEDTSTLSKYYIENNQAELFDEYLENQIGIREEYEDSGYDGIIDHVQAAIFNPVKTITYFKAT